LLLPDNAAVCTGVEITGCFHPNPTPQPAVVYRFVHEDGTVMPPIVLVLDETEALRLPAYTQQETIRAIGSARNVRRQS
jgi:predicted DNA-binding protein (UPF0251 family)